MTQRQTFIIGLNGFIFCALFTLFLLFQQNKFTLRKEEMWVSDVIDPFQPTIFDTVVIKNIHDGYVQFQCLDKKLRSKSIRKFKWIYSPMPQ